MGVVVIEPELSPRGASWGNAGHIATEQVEPLASMATLRAFPRRLFWRGGALSLPASAWAAWLPFARRMMLAARPARFVAGKQALSAMLAHALPAWRRLLDHAGASGLLREQGHLIVWETAESTARGKKHWASTDTGEARLRDLTGTELIDVEALLSTRLAGGIRFEGSGQIADLGALADALAARLDRRVAGKAVAIVKEADGVAVHLADGEVITGDIAVVAAGVASPPLLRPHGLSVPLIAERGYHIQSEVADADWPMDTPPIVFEDRSMIVTRFRSGLRAASFVEFATAARPADPRKWARLRHHAAALGLPIREDAKEWMGARPTLPDYLPAIGRCAGFPELLYAFGHQHLGLTLAACTAEAIGALAVGEARPFDLAPFDLARFG